MERRELKPPTGELPKPKNASDAAYILSATCNCNVRTLISVVDADLISDLTSPSSYNVSLEVILN